MPPAAAQTASPPHAPARDASVLPDPPVMLAPMAGITDAPFRRIVARFGAGRTTSEMVASAEVLADRAEARGRAGGLSPGEAVQLIGREPQLMAEAARLVADLGATVIDINFGCPARRVTTGACGAALMREGDRAQAIVAAVAGAVDLPVTVKMRLGWDAGEATAPGLARALAGAGARLVAVHGRTRCQFYTGSADWAAIAPVVASAGVPVVANGDITDAPTARAALAASGAAGVMVGRGAQGRPWVPALIAAALHGRPAPVVPQGSALADLVCEHHEDALLHYGRALGTRVVRKHLAWYLDAAGVQRGPVLTAEDPAEVARHLRAALADAPAPAPAPDRIRARAA